MYTTKVNGFKVNTPGIAEVIDKLAEADGSALHVNRVEHLVEATRLLARAIVEEVTDQLTPDEE